MSSCGFTLAHYRDLLIASSETFEFATFSTDPSDTRRIFLRHDIDVSVKNAVQMAELEAECGVESTYFVAVNSPYYNLFNDSQIERLREIADYGHTIGLHVDERGAYMDNFDEIESSLESLYDLISNVIPLEKVISFHMPSEYDFTRTDTIGEFINAYSTKFTDGEQVKYLSDSNRRWREGCFCNHLDDLSAHSYQVLTHPIWWHEEPLTNKELYERLQTTNQEGLRVNLQNDIGLFADLQKDVES